MPEIVVQCEALQARFGNKTVFSDLNLTCVAGEILAVVGASGCGKTTLLRMMAGLISVSGGTLKAPPNPAMVFQDSRLLPWCTVLENVTLMDRTLNQAAIETLKRIELGDYLHAYPHQLSGGMQRRVSLARAFVHTGDLLLMDEPFTGLDPHLRRDLHQVVISLWAHNKPSIVLVTHDFEDAIALADRTVVLPSVQCGTMREIRMDLARESRATDSWWASRIREQLWGVADVD